MDDFKLYTLRTQRQGTLMVRTISQVVKGVEYIAAQSVLPIMTRLKKAPVVQLHKRKTNVAA